MQERIDNAFKDPKTYSDEELKLEIAALQDHLEELLDSEEVADIVKDALKNHALAVEDEARLRLNDCQ